MLQHVLNDSDRTDRRNSEEEEGRAPQEERPDAHPEVGTREQIDPFAFRDFLFDAILHMERECDQSAGDRGENDPDDPHSPVRGAISPFPCRRNTEPVM